MQPFARPLSVGLLLAFAATHAQAAEIDEIFRTQDSNATTPFPSRKHAPRRPSIGRESFGNDYGEPRNFMLTVKADL